MSSNPVQAICTQYNIYVIKFVSDLRPVGGFLWGLQFPPPNKPDCESYSNKATLLLSWSRDYQNGSCTKCPYLKWQWIFYFWHRFCFSSITAKPFTGLDCIYIWVTFKLILQSYFSFSHGTVLLSFTESSSKRIIIPTFFDCSFP